jgi:hypothetical protein
LKLWLQSVYKNTGTMDQHCLKVFKDNIKLEKGSGDGKMFEKMEDIP